MQTGSVQTTESRLVEELARKTIGLRTEDVSALNFKVVVIASIA